MANLQRPYRAEIVSKQNPGLAPGATLCRRSAAEYRPEQMRYCASEIAPAIHEFIGATDSPMLNEG